MQFIAARLGAGLVLRLLRRAPPDELAFALAEQYPAVPEMALHKYIEIRALTKPQVGRGLDLGCGDGIVGGMLARQAGWTDLHGCDVARIDRATVLSRGYRVTSSPTCSGFL